MCGSFLIGTWEILKTTVNILFYHLLQEGYQRFDHRIHAFCLMSNHVHLAIEVGAIPLAPIMQNISFRYTRWINQRQKRMGHLFQGRYKALLVDQENYLSALIRYIHLNPIRAGVVKELVEFPWSSHLAYLGKRRQHPLLSFSFRTDHSSSGSSLSTAGEGIKKCRAVTKVE